MHGCGLQAGQFIRICVCVFHVNQPMCDGNLSVACEGFHSSKQYIKRPWNNVAVIVLFVFRSL